MASDPTPTPEPGPVVWDWHRLEHTLGPAASAVIDGDIGLAERVVELEGRLDRLLLLFDAMRELLQDQGLFNEAALIARAQAIDLRDGVADGRHTSEVQKLVCQQCQRELSRRAMRCFYCGCRELRPK